MATAELPTTYSCTNEEYHSDHDAVSHSMSKDFRKSRRRFEALYVTHTMKPPEPTPAMRLGTLVHTRLLEPERFHSTHIVAPKVDKRTKAGKQLWEEFCNYAAGKVLLEADEYDKVQRIADAVLANKLAVKLLAGLTEDSIKWQDDGTGLVRRARRDKVRDADLLVDLKTAKDASREGFAKAAASFSYNSQAAWYIDSQLALNGNADHDVRMVFIAVCTEPPHEVGLYELDAAAVNLGRDRNRAALDALAVCYETEDFSQPEEAAIVTLSLPRWAALSDYQMED